MQLNITCYKPYPTASFYIQEVWYADVALLHGYN
jgi:hypothetical protein